MSVPIEALVKQAFRTTMKAMFYQVVIISALIVAATTIVVGFVHTAESATCVGGVGVGIIIIEVVFFGEFIGLGDQEDEPALKQLYSQNS